jgi:hypothetical protein
LKSIFFTVFILAIIFASCSKKKIDNKSAHEIKPRVLYSREIKRVPYNTLYEVNGALKVKPAVEVRMANKAELSSVPGFFKEKEVAKHTTLGIGYVGLGLVAPPLYVSALVVGGVLIATGTLTLGAIDGIQTNTIEGVLEKIDFSALTHKAIIESLDYNKTSESNNCKLTILILVYGFTKKYSGTICFSVDAEIKLQVNGEEIYKDLVYIEPYLRSEDAPPPQCALAGEFSEKKGKLARQTIEDFSVILANIVAHRLPALSWKN